MLWGKACGTVSFSPHTFALAYAIKFYFLSQIVQCLVLKGNTWIAWFSGTKLFSCHVRRKCAAYTILLGHTLQSILGEE